METLLADVLAFGAWSCERVVANRFCRPARPRLRQDQGVVYLLPEECIGWM